MNDSPDVPYPEDKAKMRLEIYQALNRILTELKEIKEILRNKEKSE